MQIKQKIYLNPIIIVLFAFGLIYLADKPLLAKIQQLSQLVEQQQMIMKNPDFQVKYQKQINQLKADYEEVQPKLSLLKQSLLDKDKAVELIKILEKAAQINNLGLNIQILPEEKDGLNFALFLTGNFPDLLRFLEYIENSQYTLKITSLQIKNLPKSEQIQSNVEIKVYLNQ